MTERAYIEGLQQSLPREGAPSVKVIGVGEDPKRVLDRCLHEMREAERQDEPYDWACVLVDVDEHTTLEACLQGVRREQKVRVIVSNPKFEQWLLWHREESRAPRTGRELDRLVRDYGLLVKGKHLAPDFPFHEYTRAERHAGNCPANEKGPNPSSAMPVLLRLLRGGADGRRGGV